MREIWQSSAETRCHRQQEDVRIRLFTVWYKLPREIVEMWLKAFNIVAGVDRMNDEWNATFEQKKILFSKSTSKMCIELSHVIKVSVLLFQVRDTTCLCFDSKWMQDSSTLNVFGDNWERPLVDLYQTAAAKLNLMDFHSSSMAIARQQRWHGKTMNDKRKGTKIFPISYLFFKYRWVSEMRRKTAENGQSVGSIEEKEAMKKKRDRVWVRNLLVCHWLNGDIFTTKTNPRFHRLFGYTIRPL